MTASKVPATTSRLTVPWGFSAAAQASTRLQGPPAAPTSGHPPGTFGVDRARMCMYIHEPAHSGTTVIELPDERRRRILEAIERDGKVFAADLATAYTTSEDTIRRDLRELDRAGLLRRVHGG